MGLWRHLADRWIAAASRGYRQDLRWLVTAEVAGGTVDPALTSSRTASGLSALGWATSGGWIPLPWMTSAGTC